MASHSGSGNNQRHNHLDAQSNDLRNCKVSASFDKASVDADTSMQVTRLHKESISGAGVPENTFTSVFSSPAPTFTFHVSCKNGIELFVDLNSSPSDWIESLKSGVHIDHVVQMPQSQSFHEDIGLLSYHKQKNASVTVDKETNKGQLQDGSCPTTILTDNLQEIDEPDGEGSLSSPGLKSIHNAVYSLENSIDKKEYFSFRLESGIEEKLVGSKSDRSEEMYAADSDLNAAFQTKMYCDFMGSFLPSDPECSVIPPHLGANAGNGICIKPPLQQTSCSLDPVLKISESLTNVCMGMQVSTCAITRKDMKFSPSGNGGCLNVADQIKKNEMMQSGILKYILTPSTILSPVGNSIPQHLSADELEMWSAQAVDQSTCLYPVGNSIPQHLADDRRKKDEENRIFDIKFDRLIRKTEAFLAGSHSKNRYLSPGQAVDHSTILSPGVNRCSQYLADKRRKKDEENRIFDLKFDRLIRETETLVLNSPSKNRYFSPGCRFVSQDVIDLTDDSEAENVGCLRRQEAGSEIDRLQQNNAAHIPCSKDGSLGLAVPEQSGADHHISTKSNDHILDICRSPSAANGQSNTNGREGSECLDSENLMDKPWNKPSDPESTGAHKRKRNFNIVEHLSKSINTEAKILRSSKQITGNGHSERRRSLRLFNK